MESVEDIRKSLPEQPGVYKYYDREGKLLYIGKAKSLKKRVNSYFTKTHPDYKTQLLVRQIAYIQYVVTNNELEALLLENSLIKEHQPKYNIDLKDGKSYPYICIKNERFPRVFSTRQKTRDGSSYYGPYPSVGTMRALLRFLHDNFQLRTCKYNLSAANIAAGKFRPCLEYHIGRCRAPCVALQAEDDYNANIRQVRQVLRGSFGRVLAELKEQMNEAVEQLQYERAHYLKIRMEQLQKHKQKSTIVSEQVHNVEVFTVARQDKLTVVNHFKMQSGSIITTHAFDSWDKHGEDLSEVLTAAILRVAAEDEDFHPHILVNVLPSPDELPATCQAQVPERGDERKIVELGLKNCEVLLEEKLQRKYEQRANDPQQRLLRRAMEDLKLARLPYHIECFDNSNIQGYAPVSSCVVFRNGRPAKRDYRVYNIRTVEGPDDFASMREVVYRRYRRLLEEEKPLPDLVLIDGGKGQLSHALEALEELGLRGQLPILSIAKRLEEIYYPDDPVPLYIDKKSPTLRLLQQLRDEAHKTAIEYHRKKRDEKTLKTELTEIAGIGPGTAKKLLSHFRSLKKVKEASLNELIPVVGEAKAEAVHRHYQAYRAAQRAG